MTNTHTYHVAGMTCGGCAGKVTATLEQIPGVTGVAVELVDKINGGWLDLTSSAFA